MASPIPHEPLHEKDFMMTTTNEFQVTGMSCGHCEASVKRHVSEIPGVQHVEVSAASGRLLIGSSEALVDDVVIAAVDEAGYQAARV
jgi:copper chaperone CopZ